MALTVWTAVISTSGCLASKSVLASMHVSSPGSPTTRKLHAPSPYGQSFGAASLPSTQTHSRGTASRMLGPWMWSDVATLLEQQGLSVYVPDLPSMGSNPEQTPLGD